MKPTRQRILQLSNGRTIPLNYSTDAGTLHWLLTHNLIPREGPDYELLRRIVFKRFNMRLESFIDLQKFPPTNIPLLDAREFIDELPEEAFDALLWAHPMVFVIHDWVDSGLELKPLFTGVRLESDLHAAVYVIRKKLKEHYVKVDNWIAINFNLTRTAFEELFVRTRVLQSSNYYSKHGNGPGVICRYRRDVARLIDRGNAWVHKADEMMPSIFEQSSEAARDIHALCRKINKLTQILNTEELLELARESERIIGEWQTLRSTRTLRQEPRKKNAAITKWQRTTQGTLD